MPASSDKAAPRGGQQLLAGPSSDALESPSPHWTDREAEALGFRPLGSRLRPPTSRIRLVRRDALLASLSRDRRPLVLVTAPAGYGKTIALSQWAAAGDRPSAWLQLDEADNDPVVLLAYLALAAGSITEVDPAILALLRLRTPPVEEQILPALAAAIAAAEPFVLVLDDGHLVHADECWRLVGVLLEHFPEGAQLCVGSRTTPSLPLARLRAAGRLAELGPADLALDRRETRELLTCHECELEAAALDDLLALTEGWPAGLRLALMARDGANGPGLLSGVRGDQHAIAAYLTEEVLERQPDELQTFLLRTSILDRLSPELCSAVACDGRSAEHLEALARDCVFITAIDDHDEWFRYHHLFGELLQTLERRRAAAELPELHRRAAAWLCEHGDVERAVGHWLAANDARTAALPAFEACFDLVDRGQVESARRLLDSFTDRQLGEHVPLTMAAGWFYGTVVGDPVKGESWRRAACTMDAGNEPMPDGSATWRSYQMALRAFLAPEGVVRMLDDAELGLACAREAGVSTAEARRVLGVASYLNGRLRQAAGVFREMLEESDEASIRSYALAFLSLIAADEGREEDAQKLDREALELTPTMTLDISPGMYLALPMVLAHVRALALRRDPDLEAAMQRAERYAADMVPQIPWRLLLIAVTLGDVRLARGETDEAERWARSVEALLAAGPEAGSMLSGRAARLRKGLEERRMSDPLTAAERRVLDLLPTQLTAAQMAARLFLTTNTVKSHMARIYRKLGVTTRTDAVETARRLGLL